MQREPRHDRRESVLRGDQNGHRRHARSSHQGGITVIRARSGRSSEQACAIRNSQYLNNGLEQDHRSTKGRYGPMRGFKSSRSAGRSCRTYDQLRNFPRSRSQTNQQVSADYRRFHFLRRIATVLRVLQASWKISTFIPASYTRWRAC
ncbi:DDE-type integrase/transposase/recombinase [Acidisphaera sp. S103]|uniref:DDE-type integrase/transposase/recombinase n=1 Tax=Acidisphaera sp. S103 TaxID=1747223 RepID=UPI00352E31B1